MNIREFLNLLNIDKDSNTKHLCGTYLKQWGDVIKTLDEFKGVKELNFLEMPAYYVDMNGTPFTGHTYGLSKAESVNTVNLGDENTFNDVVDIYSIGLSPRMYPTKSLIELGPGVFISPNIYDPESFMPYREIRIIFSPESAPDMNFTMNDFKDFVSREIDKLKVDNGIIKTNYEYTQYVTVRCSTRSYRVIE